MGNLVNNFVMAMYDARWVLDLLGESPHKLYGCLANVLYTPETTIKWYWMSAVIKKRIQLVIANNTQKYDNIIQQIHQKTK